MKALFETLQIAVVIAICMFGLFAVLCVTAPKPPISSGID